ncbi:MAG TPA: sugar-transfer associated ATP-grasp domain-containing protein [Kiloniellaceae bacterium]
MKADIGKSQFRQLLEIGVLGLKGYRAADYYQLELYKDVARAKKFMTNGEYNRIRSRLNEPACGIIEFNKWIFAKYCESLGIPTPHCYGVFHREYGFDESEKPLRDLPSLSGLLDSVGGAIVVKPLAGDRGDNVRVFDGIDPARQVVVAPDGTACSYRQLHDFFLTRKTPWLLQEKVKQHGVLADLHQSSVNTARVITLRGDSGDIAILSAALRIGVGSAEIDNTTLGGLAAEIDLETGVCRAATSRFSIRTTVAHPDSGCRIEGLALPYWDLVKASAVKAHRFLPFARSLGWDIAFGIEGPIILEVNGSWYYNRVQMTGRSLWETEFGSSLAGQGGQRKRRL